MIGAQLFPFFFVSVVSSAAALLASVVYLRRRVSLLPRFDFAEWRELVRDTLPYAAAVTVGILYPRVGLIVVSLICQRPPDRLLLDGVQGRRGDRRDLGADRQLGVPGVRARRARRSRAPALRDGQGRATRR